MKFSRSRRHFLAQIASTSALLIGSASIAWSTDIASLRDTLRAGLKCRRDEEFEFVDVVVGFVQEGKLPEDLVLNTFRWARGKRDDFPFPYFVEAMRRRAAVLNVDL